MSTHTMNINLKRVCASTVYSRRWRKRLADESRTHDMYDSQQLPFVYDYNERLEHAKQMCAYIEWLMGEETKRGDL